MPPPELTVQATALARADAPVLAVPLRRVDGTVVADDAARALLADLGIDPGTALANTRATGKAGSTVDIPVTLAGRDARRVLLVGLGEGSAVDLRRAGAALARALLGVEHAATATPAGLAPAALRAHLEGLLLAAYTFRAEGAGRDPEKAPVRRLDAHLGRRPTKQVTSAVDAARATAAAAHTARDLGNTTSDVKDPAWLAAQATDLARSGGLEVRVRDERELAAGGFGGILGVGMGSARPPRLIELSYRRTRASRRVPHVVLVGKGITFDTGGLSLKPRDAMLGMKTDMAAGGVVVAVMAALRDARVRVRVTGLVPAAENMPGRSALRPGDVLTHVGGRTVEVFNTDAEGRLVLADALAYADAELDPDLLVDVATLTGAASMGLGRRHGALYSADEELVAGLVAAGEASGERLWRMPLVEDYRPALDSTVADLANISRDPSISGGSITAALFLREFVGARRWAHLDIAGPARADRDEHEVTKGATGFGARLLLRWLEGLA